MTATQPENPQIYLVTPPAFDPAPFAETLARILDAIPVACLRLSMANSDEDEISRAGDALRDIAHSRDVAIVIERHVILAERLGLDGVHLPRGTHGIRKLREQVGPDAIIGASCGTSRHDGLNAAEAGADYVAFSPVGDSSLDDGTRVPREIFEWWSEVIEVPVVAEGALTRALIGDLAPVTDFFALGDEIWSTDDPLATLRELVSPLDL